LDVSVYFHVFEKHQIRTDPETGLVVKGAVPREDLEGLTVTHEAYQLVLASLVVPVMA